MRRLTFLSAACCCVFIACGGDSSVPERSSTVRKCGELEGVQPVEPVIVGEYPIDVGPDGTGSCPMFAPVPCTEPLSEYASLCGDECAPQTAEGVDGDTWLVGCAWALRGPCTGFDFELVECSRDPYSNDPYWFVLTECKPVFLPLSYCWPRCDGRELPGEPPEWCPED